jgi:signal transduction histidine kinase
VVTRAWNSVHGGVYAPVTPYSQPNEYLIDSLRDIVTKEGMLLTKINPAYMTRQIAEIIQTNYGLKFNITSLNPIRPANSADEWETKALKSFEKGTPEILELTDKNIAPQYRYMAPLITEQSCLKCHAVQGYEVGDIRGGISISFPASLYLSLVKKSIVSIILIHLLIFCIVLIGLIIFYKQLTSAYSKIEIKNSELVEINTTKDKFFSIIAHDLKSPFNSIVGFSKYLVEQVEEKNYENIGKFANIMLQSSNKAMDLLTNLMTWAQSQTGRMEYNPEYFEMTTLVKEATLLLHGIAEQKSIVIENKITTNTQIYADKEMISIVLRNLISNALKFTTTGGKITISTEHIKNELTVTISDNGVGISKDRINKIFNIIENYSTPGTQKETGTGLGLILCKEFIEKNNGRIWVKSTVGIGSSFSFSIPTIVESA